MPRQQRTGRVRITGGMREFVGRTGRIVRLEDHGLYRVQLDEPVKVEGVGTVHDDLWESQYLERILGS
jgi:hypothetical protein